MKKVQNGTGTLADLAAPEVTAKVVKHFFFKEIREVEETPQEVIEEGRKYITKIPEFMNKAVARVHVIQAMPVEKRMMCYAELESLIATVLSHLEISESATPEEKLLNEAARQAYTMATIATLPSDERAILAAIDGKDRLPGFLKLGVLGEPNGKNANVVKIFGKTYAVNGGRAQEIAGKLRQLVGEAYGKKIEAIKAKATISIDELLDGKAGHAFINAPDDKDGDRFLPGGVLLIRSDGKVVKVMEFLGHFRKIMTEIAEAGTFLLVKSLSEEHLYLGEKMSEGTRRHVKILHSILRRGIAVSVPKLPLVEAKSQTLPAGDTAAMLH